MKKVSALIFSGATYLSLATHAFAETPINPCPEANPDGANFNILCTLAPGGSLISFLVTVAFIAASLIALGFLIFGGIKWIMSGGDKSGVEAARNMIVAALVGLVITFLAYLIINVVFTFFNLGSITGLVLPTIPTH